MRHLVTLMNRSVTKRVDERRLTGWLVASLALHAFVLGLAGPLGKPFPRALENDQATPVVLQALISHPSAPVLAPPEPSVAPPIVEPPLPAPVVEPPARPPPSTAARADTADEASDGASGTPGRITVGVLHDLAEAGLAQASRLQQKYPTKAGREPRLRGALAVAYPAKALEMHTSARIVAVLTIDAQGELIDAALVPNDPVFGPAVMSALRNVRFAPGEIGGVRADYWMLLEVVFSTSRGSRVEGSPPPRAPARRPQG